MKAFTYVEKGRFAMTEKAKPIVLNAKDAVVRVTLGSIRALDEGVEMNFVNDEQIHKFIITIPRKVENKTANELPADERNQVEELSSSERNQVEELSSGKSNQAEELSIFFL